MSLSILYRFRKIRNIVRERTQRERERERERESEKEKDIVKNNT